MKITSLDIVGQLERLAESCPWDTVSLWLYRYPEGKYTFTTHVDQQDKFGFPSIFGSGGTPSEAVDEHSRAVRRARRPRIARDRKD